MTAAAGRAFVTQQAAHGAAPSAPRLLQGAQLYWRRGETAAYLAVWQPQIARPCTHNARLWSPACTLICRQLPGTHCKATHLRALRLVGPQSPGTTAVPAPSGQMFIWLAVAPRVHGAACPCVAGAAYLLVFSLEVCAAYASSQGSLSAAVGCLASCIAARSRLYICIQRHNGLSLASPTAWVTTTVSCGALEHCIQDPCYMSCRCAPDASFATS